MADSTGSWSATGRAVTRRLQAIDDPAKRAKAAARELEKLSDQVSQLSTLRLQAIAELRKSELSYQQIADRLGLTRERVAQLTREAQRLNPDD